MKNLAQIEVVVFLQSVDLFSFCSAEEILRISSIVSERSVAAGETIYETGKAAAALFCLVRGSVNLTSANGEKKWVGPLQTFGGEEILSGRLRTATATAESDCLVLAIDAEDFFDLLSNNVEIVKALFRQFLPDSPALLLTPAT